MDGSHIARADLTFWRAGRVQSSVRPVDAAGWRLLEVGTTSLVRRARAKPEAVDPRITAMLQCKPVRVVTVAAANRTARVAWAIMTRGESYRAPTGATA